MSLRQTLPVKTQHALQAMGRMQEIQEEDIREDQHSMQQMGGR
jgi:hypothetical protein